MTLTSWHLLLLLLLPNPSPPLPRMDFVLAGFLAPKRQVPPLFLFGAHGLELFGSELFPLDRILEMEARIRRSTWPSIHSIWAGSAG